MKKMLIATGTAAFMLAAPLVAQSQTQPEVKVEKRIIVMEGKGAPKAGDARVFEFRQTIDGESRDVTPRECVNGNKTEVNEGTDKEKTKIFVCTKGDLSNAEQVERLEEIRASIGRGAHFSEQNKGKVEAALTEAINRARAGK